MGFSMRSAEATVNEYYNELPVRCWRFLRAASSRLSYKLMFVRL